MSTTASERASNAVSASMRAQIFFASCVALVATALVFSVRGDILGDLEKHFSLSHAQVGLVSSFALWGFMISIFIGGQILDHIGVKSVLVLAFLAHILGTVLTIYATGYWFLLGATLIIGIGNGFVEAAINPLIASIYTERKTHMLNSLHAWWPGGLVIGSLLSKKLGLMGFDWKIKMWTILIPVAIYGVMLLRLRFPRTERVEAGVTTKDMYLEALKPAFMLWFVCMLFTAATELGTGQWIGEIMKGAGISDGILILAWISGIMLVGRLLAGNFIHRLSPVGLLMCSSVLAFAGLIWMGSVHSRLEAYASSFIFALGVCYWWPTMLGVTSERFPKGGSFLLALMGAAGMTSAGAAQPILGSLYGKYGAGKSLQIMAVLPAILFIIFAIVYLADRAKGGYKAVDIKQA